MTAIKSQNLSYIMKNNFYPAAFAFHFPLSDGWGGQSKQSMSAFSSHPPAAPYAICVCVCAHEPEKGAAWANNFACIHHGVKSGGAFRVRGWVGGDGGPPPTSLSPCTLNQTHERVREAVAGRWHLTANPPHELLLCRIALGCAGDERPRYYFLAAAATECARSNSRLWKLIIAGRLIPLTSPSLFVWRVILCVLDKVQKIICKTTRFCQQRKSTFNAFCKSSMFHFICLWCLVQFSGEYIC